MPIIFEKSWLRRYDLCALLAYYQSFVAPPFTRERAEAERMLSSRIAEIIRFFIVMIFV